MTLKSYFSKIRFAYKQTLSQYMWITAIYSVLLFFIGIIMPLISNQNPEKSIVTNLNWMRDITGVYFTILAVAGVFAAISASSVFTYLDETESTDFYLSQPVTRLQMFTGRFLGGLSTFVIPSVVSTVIFTAIIKLSHIPGTINTMYEQYYFGPGTLFVKNTGIFTMESVMKIGMLVKPFLMSLLIMFIAYCICVFAKVLVKGVMNGVLLAGLTTFGPLASVYFFYNSVNEIAEKRFEKYGGVLIFSKISDYLNPLNMFFETDIYKEYDNMSYTSTITWTVVALVLLAAAVLLVKYRRAENASKNIAFNSASETVKYAMTTFGTLFGIAFAFIFARNGNSFYFNMALTAFFTGLLFNMLFGYIQNRDRKKLFSSKNLLFCSIIVFTIIITVFVLAAKLPVVPYIEDYYKGGILS